MEENIRKEINREVKEIIEKEKQNTQPPTTKSINEVSVGDIQFELNKNKTYEEQAEDVVGAMATAKAVSDEETAKKLAEKKAEELKAKASKKLKTAQTEDIKATTELQKAEREKHETVLQTFGITKQLPNWLLYIMLVPFTPLFIIISLVIGIPCGIVKVTIDNIDNILVRYESADEKNRPKIKVTVWIVFVLALLGLITFIVLKALGKV